MHAFLLRRARTTRVRSLTTVAVAMALTVACTQGDTAEPLPSEQPAPRTTLTTVPSQPPAPTPAPGSGAPTAAATASAVPSAPAPSPGATESEPQVATSTCTLESRADGLPTVTLTYPSDWQVDDTDAGCGYLDPGDPEVEPATEASGVDVRAFIDAVDFTRAAEPGPSLTEASRLPTTVDGRQAVRVQGTTPGAGWPRWRGPGGQTGAGSGGLGRASLTGPGWWGARPIAARSGRQTSPRRGSSRRATGTRNVWHRGRRRPRGDHRRSHEPPGG